MYRLDSPSINVQTEEDEVRACVEVDNLRHDRSGTKWSRTQGGRDMLFCILGGESGCRAVPGGGQ
jgi:hypothetical protein